MDTNLSIVLRFLEKCWQKIPRVKGKGVDVTYSHGSMVLFFILMMLKKKFAFRAMEKYAKIYFKYFGWSNPPSRTTIRRRFLLIPSILHILMPQIAKECDALNHQIFGFSWAFIDKSVFRAMGGIWHKIHIKLGIVPHPSIDTEASWGFSPYHRWRFGYGLHLISNQNRFPIVALVTTAKAKDVLQVPSIISQILTYIGVLVGDAGYFASRTIQKIGLVNVFLYTHKTFTKAKTTFQKNYNNMANTVQARILYRKRKSSVEPVFSIIKEIYDLNGNNPLPYKGLKFVQSFLMTTTVSIQAMMFLNYTLQQELGKTDTILNLF